MKINVFEGARRIALLTGILWAIGVAAYLWIEQPRIEITYIVDWPGSHPKRVISDNPYEQDCFSQDASEVEYRTTQRGTNLRALICFRAQKADDGELAVPYRMDRDKKQWWGGARYSSEVSGYTSKVANNLEVSTADEAWADERYWPARWKQIGIAAAWLLGGLIALWVFTFTVGWIVRGFAGIPMGKDHRPSSEDPKEH